MNEKKETKDDPRKEQVLPKLDWKDYVALTAAALQTVALPFILIAVLVFLLAIVLTWLPA
jgi:hypothetical protein